ncbi:MAG: glycosyltransferase family 4 protein, partial [Actinomycetota bacterium]|nr:glycosyltransferase family 4 protein [Actinomycetota bacterium]
MVPTDVGTPTGGNVYDLALAHALRSGGDEVQVLRCAAPGLADALRRPWQGPTLVDGLLACPQPQAVTAAPVTVLVHMPLALESGLSREVADRLDRLERQALHAAVRVVATSAWSARYLERHHGLDEVVVARPGVEPAPVVAGSDPPQFVQLAALLPHKDQLGVVAALARLTDLSWRARLAGPADRDPAYANAVRETVAAAGLGDRVEIPGTMPRESAWAGADLALLPSRVESFGMVVTEALARGVPAVVSEGGAAEALGVCGTGVRPGAVVPAGDPAALEAVLRRWLTDAAYRGTLRSA